MMREYRGCLPDTIEFVWLNSSLLQNRTSHFINRKDLRVNLYCERIKASIMKGLC